MVDEQQPAGQTDHLDNQAPRQTDQKEGLWTISKLMEQYGIGKDPLYKRMAYLKIRPWKMGNRSYLDDEQLAYMDGLHDHIQRTGKMEGYPVPEPSGPWEKELAIVSTDAAIAPLDDETPEELPPGSVAPHISDKELEAMDRQAQFIAAGRYVATQELADYYANTGSFTIPEVLQRVKERRAQTQNHWEEAHRSADPKALSQLLIRRAKQKTAGACDGQDLP